MAAIAVGGTMLVALALIAASDAAAQAQQPRSSAQATTPPAQPTPRPATVPQPVPEVFESWEMRCFQDAQGAQACRIQTVIREQNNRPQLAVVVRPPAAADQPPVATVTPPWGVLLARGIDMQVDTRAALRIPIRTCLPSGCLADFSLIDTLNSQLLGGATLKLTMAAANGQALTIDVPLAGYAKAYARLMEKAKR